MKPLSHSDEILRAYFSPGTLYMVATPIGNLADMSKRAMVSFACADIICAEDTRVTRRLLSAHGIGTKIVSVREHNEVHRAEQVCQWLSEQKIVVYASDAGTPAVSDPGARLVDAVWQAGFRVSPVPGPCAAIAALSASGVSGTSFFFAGFLPATRQQRRLALARFTGVDYAVVCYEAPHRIEALLADVVAVLGEARKLILAREITKKFEIFMRLPAASLMDQVQHDKQQQRGEITLIIEPLDNQKNTQNEPREEGCRVLKLLAKQMPIKQAVSLAAKITGCDKRFLYAFALTLKTHA